MEERQLSQAPHSNKHLLPPRVAGSFWEPLGLPAARAAEAQAVIRILTA